MIPQPKLTWVLTVTNCVAVKDGVMPTKEEYAADSWEDLLVEIARFHAREVQGAWSFAMSIHVEMRPIMLVVGPGGPLVGGTPEKAEPQRWPHALDQLRALLGSEK